MASQDVRLLGADAPPPLSAAQFRDPPGTGGSLGNTGRGLAPAVPRRVITPQSVEAIADAEHAV